MIEKSDKRSSCPRWAVAADLGRVAAVDAVEVESGSFAIRTLHATTPHRDSHPKYRQNLKNH